jgi:hypothetical protein
MAGTATICGSRTVRLVITALAVLATAVVLAAPASAVDTDRRVQNVESGQRIFATAVGGSEATTTTCCTRIVSWKFEPRGTSPSGHVLAKFQSNQNNGCLDSHGVSSSQVFNIACNTGDYQLWEVFNNSNGTQTFKSWGDFTHGNLNTCMAAFAGDGHLYVLGCNASVAAFQWRNA